MDPLAAVIDDIFTDTFDEAEIVGDVYGIKYIFAKADDNADLRAVVMTTTSSTREQAEERRARMVASPGFRCMMMTWFSLHKMKEDNPTAWSLIASKVVQLAVIPF